MFENSGMINLPKWWCEKVIEFKWYRDKQGRRVVISEFTIEYMNVSKAMRKHIKKDSQSGKYIPKTRNELWTLCYYLEDDDIALGDIDTSNITDMRGIFNSSLFLERVDYSGIETWDTSKVVDKTELFKGAKSFNYNINSWNVSNVVSMCLMFANAEKFNQPLNNWDTSSVEFMTKMFNYAESFNQNLNSWDVSSVRDNAEMFLGSGMDKLPK